MNLPQRIVLAGAAIIIAGMILFPPWLFIYDPPKGYLYFHKTIRPAGYHLLFAPHVAEDQTELERIFGLPPDQRLNYFSAWRRADNYRASCPAIESPKMSMSKPAKRVAA